MIRNCSGPAIAAAPQGIIFLLKVRRNKNGNTAKMAKKTTYHVSDNDGLIERKIHSKCSKCHAHSSAVTETRPTAGIQSSESNFVAPSNSTTSSNASPKTGEGFVSG